jgi:hypothetical protein
MSRQFLILIAIAALSTGLATKALGQTGTVRANVKFDFQIGERIYPAGEYRIESISRQSDNILPIRSVVDANKNQLIIAGHSNAGKRQTPKLVFQRYGENYFLTKIFLDTGRWGNSIRPSLRQRTSEEHSGCSRLEAIESGTFRNSCLLAMHGSRIMAGWKPLTFGGALRREPAVKTDER